MNTNFKVSAIILTILLIIGVGFASAVDPIPKEAGFSGFVRPGVGYMEIKSNMVAEFGSNDVSDDRISSLGKEPDGESNGLLLLPFKLSYTFSNLKTQAFLGTELTDLLRFDSAYQLGIKHSFESLGIIQAGILFSGMGTEVWSDPYVVDQKRRTTDRDSMGVKLAWGNVLNTKLDLTYTYQNIDVDKERSGDFLGLSPSDKKLLERDGDLHIFEAAYDFVLTGDHHLTPAFIYQIDDRDGDARSNDEYSFRLSYAYLGEDPFSFVCKGFIGWADYDERNPIPDFNNKRQDDDIYGLGATLYYKNPWGWSLWGSNPITFYVDGSWVERDANIDFYYERIIVGSLGAMFRW